MRMTLHNQKERRVKKDGRGDRCNARPNKQAEQRDLQRPAEPHPTAIGVLGGVQPVHNAASLHAKAQRDARAGDQA